MQVRHDASSAHHSLNCLIQLSSLNGSVMTNKSNRVEYLINYVTNFLSMLDRLKAAGSIQPVEALGCSNIVRKIMLFFPPSILVNLPQHLLEAYLKQITQMTCHFMKAASQTDSVKIQTSAFLNF